MYLPPEEKFGIRLTNRGGAMKNAEYKIKSLNEPSTRPCFYPSYDFFVDYNGDILMCSHDWLKKNVLGNLNEQDFSEIWLGKKLKYQKNFTTQIETLNLAMFVTPKVHLLAKIMSRNGKKFIKNGLYEYFNIRGSSDIGIKVIEAFLRQGYNVTAHYNKNKKYFLTSSKTKILVLLNLI